MRKITTKETWLLIEDDVDDQDLFLITLSGLTDRVDCVIAKNGLEALRIIQQDDNLIPSCIILDLNMPLMNGFEFLQNAKHIVQLAKVPIIVYTTSSAPADKERVLKLGASFVTKHHTLSQLQQFILDCLSRYTHTDIINRFEKELTSVNGRNVYELLLDSAVEKMNSDHASIQLYCNKTQQLTLMATRNFHPQSIDFWQTISAASGSVCGEALRRQTCVAVSDVETIGYVKEEIEMFRLSKIRAVQSIPLVAPNGELIGMISAHWKDRRQFSEKDIQSFEVFARFSSGILSQK